MVALLIVAFFSLLAGVYLLAVRLYIWDGALLLLLGLVGLTLTLGRVFFPDWHLSWPRARSTLDFAGRVRRWGRVGAVALSGWVGAAARSRPDEADYTLLFCAWLLAMAVYLAASFYPAHVAALRRMQFTRWEWGGLGLLLLLALLLRALALGTIPVNFGGDEGTQALAAYQLVHSQGMGNPFATGWYSVPTLSFALYGLALRVFGATMAGARALSVVFGVLTVLMLFILGQALGGRRVGWIAATVVACSAYHIHFSRLASNQIADGLVGALALWLLWRALRYQDATAPQAALAWGAAGVVAGCGWYLYFGARWVTFMLGLWLLWRMLLEPRFWIRYRRGLALLAGGWLAAALPLLAWYAAHPSDLTARYNAVSIFASGWLSREVELTGKSALALLGQQFWKSVSAFHLTPDPTFWYYPESPLLDFVSGALMLVGMVAATLRWRWPSRGITLLWFWSTLVMAWVLTENPPSSQRGLLLLPAAALLIAWGCEALLEACARYLVLVKPTVLALIALGCLLNISFYFAVYTPRRVYGNPTAEIATEFSRYALAHPLENGMTYFFGAPYLYWDFGAQAFLLRDQSGVDVEPGVLPQDVAAPARFVFVAARYAELEGVRNSYPDGGLTILYNPAGAFLAALYDWPGAP